MKIMKVWHEDNFADSLKSLLPSDLDVLDTYFVCIGTDRSTGDSLGPLVGTALTKMGFSQIIGTLEEPCHAVNLDERISEIPNGKTIIAIDSCLGNVSSVGTIQCFKGSIHPGAGVNKKLTPVGDFGINGIVNVGGFMEYFVLQNTRLSLVLKMATIIANAIATRFSASLAECAATNNTGE